MRKVIRGISEVIKVITGVIGYFIVITFWPVIPALLLLTASCAVDKGPCAPMFYIPFWHPYEHMTYLLNTHCYIHGHFKYLPCT
jgi:hypothetical protein